MKKNNMKLVVALILMVAITLACTDPIQFLFNIKDITFPPTSTSSPKATTTSEGPAPTATRPATEPLQIETQAYSSSLADRPGEMGYKVTINNPDPGYAIADAIYEITLFDLQGVLVASKKHYVMAGPLEDAQIVSYLPVPDVSKVNSMKVEELSPGRAVAANPGEDQLEIDRITYAKNYNSHVVTGEVTSTYAEDIFGAVFTAVAYDAAGNIIGLGDQMVGPLPAAATVPISIPINLSVEPASVDLVFTPDGPTSLEPPSDLKLIVEQADVIPNSGSYSGGVVMILRNPDPARIVMTAYYSAAAYDAAGNVLATCDNPLPGVLFPGESMGFGCSLYLPIEVVPARAEVFTLVSDVETPYNDIIVNPLTADAITLDVYKVTATIHNTLPRDLNYCYALIVAYDAQGKLAGHEFYSLDTMTANESRQIEAGLYLGDAPVVRVEIYPVISSATFW